MKERYQILKTYGWFETEYPHTLKKGEVLLQWIDRNLRFFLEGKISGTYEKQQYFYNADIENVDFYLANIAF